MNDENDEDFLSFETELSDREIYSIGKIVALWGAIEFAIFSQTLETFDCLPDALPHHMNNVQPSQVRQLWKERVIDIATGTRREVLERQYKAICHLESYRHAIVHGMWDWDTAAPEKITVTRVRKKNIEAFHFTGEDLDHFARKLGTINFRIRCPGGIEDYAAQQIAAGSFSYMSRRFVAMVTDSPIAEDWLSPVPTRIENSASTESIFSAGSDITGDSSPVTPQPSGDLKDTRNSKPR